MRTVAFPGTDAVAGALDAVARAGLAWPGTGSPVCTAGARVAACGGVSTGATGCAKTPAGNNTASATDTIILFMGL
jgi:hypothetical protein